MKYSAIIGLEIHIELATKSKMFCGCLADHFGTKPNTQTCPICLGLPGALPVPNIQAIEWTVLTGLALGCKIPLFSKFDRKNYFYPDLPKGYQISQYDLPFARNGKLRLKNSRWVGIRRVHLEEDTGKLIHAVIDGEKSTLIDFNRSGVPLMEIVTEPDLISATEAKEFLQKLQQIVRYLGISEADMEKGQMRCEPTVNLKIEKDGSSFYTPLVEIKNINSFRFAQKAIDFEIKRQLREFEKTGKQKQPGNKTTRGWDEIKQETFLQREKEEAADYRYFPEPDIPPIRWKPLDIQKIQKFLPELPDEKTERFIKRYGLSEYNAEILTETRQKANYFEKAVKIGKEQKVEPNQMANLIINKKVEINKASPADFVKTIIGKQLKPKIGEAQLALVIKQVIEENRKAVEDYKGGKLNALEFLLGQVMIKTRGQVNPDQARRLLKESLLSS